MSHVFPGEQVDPQAAMRSLMARIGRLNDERGKLLREPESSFLPPAPCLNNVFPTRYGTRKFHVTRVDSRPPSSTCKWSGTAIRSKFKENTMRFMMLMFPGGYEKAKPGTLPDRKAIEVMRKYNEQLQKAGVLLALDGLHPPSMGARVTFKGGKSKVTDGPFTESKEAIGGFWMIQVKSREEALEWAS